MEYLKWTFIIILIVFCIIEIYVLRAFIIRKTMLAFQSSSVSFGLFWLLLVAIYILNLDIPYFSLILVIFVLFFNSYLGYYLDLYNKSKIFDRILHAFGSFSFALFFYYFLSNFLEYGGSSTFRALYIFLLGISLGAIFEIIEYFIDSKRDLKMQRGLKDTDADIISDIIVSMAAATFAFYTLM